ncbi:hypothetical protein ADL63_00970 [Enterococcus faecalis]|nr:hypothetical protein A7D18_01805 [Enterococcus faecalis]RNC00445.1 hypothetical protein ADL95_01140 [Enterococcus faecalis]RNC02637.1 hypothetical protein ADL82_05725 [Enterococcus faecalis]RNC06664.1 hypothetical protein ADL63_00970 [Enterococcus faecalis]RNC08382.1 hypothetical protein ADL69_06925 [Enterococcus faecalis]
MSENCSLIFGEFRLISEGVASVSAVYQFLSLGQKSKVIFVPGSFFTKKMPIFRKKRSGFSFFFSLFVLQLL